jgi:hypothetical protein
VKCHSDTYTRSGWVSSTSGDLPEFAITCSCFKTVKNIIFFNMQLFFNMLFLLGALMDWHMEFSATTSLIIVLKGVLEVFTVEPTKNNRELLEKFQECRNKK